MLRMGLQPLLLLFYPLLVQLPTLVLLRLAQLVLLISTFRTVNSVPALAYPLQPIYGPGFKAGNGLPRAAGRT